MGLPWRIEYFLCAKLVGGARRLKKHRGGDDHRQLRIEQVVKALRRRERDQRRCVGDDNFDINRYCATAVAEWHALAPDWLDAPACRRVSANRDRAGQAQSLVRRNPSARPARSPAVCREDLQRNRATLLVSVVPFCLAFKVKIYL